MSAELGLNFAGIILSFCLQVAAAYLACSLLSCVLGRPSQRFKVWGAFLACSGVYWVVLIWRNASALAGHGAAGAGTLSGDAMFPSSFLLPAAWGSRVLLASEILAVTYLATVLFLTIAALIRHLRLRLVLRHGRPASADLVRLYDAICRELGITRCELVILPGITSPATVGWLQPRVLLPLVCEEIGATPRLADVLHHELAHVVRRDYFWGGVSGLICNFLFFHPATWRAKKLMRLERELACDYAVIEARPEHRADYADSLAYFVRLRMIEEQTALGLDFAASPSSLGRRVRFILAAPPSLSWWQRTARTTIGLAAIGAFAVAAPALTVVLSFARTGPPAATTAQVQPPAAEASHRGNRTSQRASAATTQTLTSRIQARPALRETPVYSLTSSRDGSGSEPADDIAWRESNPSSHHPTVAGAVRSAVAIVLARGTIDHDRDHDHSHFAPQ